MGTVPATIKAFDLETTGVDPLTARIVTACVAELDAEGNILCEQGWVLRPNGFSIPEAAASVHGYSTERALEEGMDARTALAEIATALQGATLVAGHNLAYDATVLACELTRSGLQDGPAFIRDLYLADTFVLDRVLDKYRKGARTLTATAAHYGVALDDADAHTASADAIAAARVALQILASMNFEPDALMLMQQSAYRAQIESLTEYKRRTDPTFSADTNWPLHSLAHEERCDESNCQSR